MKKILFYILLFLLFYSCNKEQVEPIGFYEIDYTTNPNINQTFTYFYDNGDMLSGELDEHVASIHTQEGTFNNEQLLLLTYKQDPSFLPDSIIPFTYFFGTNYYNSINKNIEFRINLDYPFNLHTYYNEIFYKENLGELSLYKIILKNNGQNYYDPDIEIEQQEFIIDNEKNDIVFNTKDINAFYGFCYAEKTWTDSIFFELIDGSNSNTINIVEQGIKGRTLSNEGAIYIGNTLQLNYTGNAKHIEYTNSNNNGWHLDSMKIDINNPTEGIIQKNHVNFNCLITDKLGLTSYLILLENTQIEIIKWPNYGNRGMLKISGPIKVEAYNRVIDVNIEINFKRQR